MSSNNFYGDFMVKSVWRLSSNLIDHVFSVRNSDNSQANFTVKSS